MANELRDILLAGVDQKIREAFDDPQVQAQLEEKIQAEVRKAMGGEALTVAVLNAVRSAMGVDTRKVPTPENKPPVARGRPRRASGVRCAVVGCDRPHRSMGYCASHYQSARKHGWPMPATEPVTPGPEYRPRANS